MKKLKKILIIGILVFHCSLWAAETNRFVGGSLYSGSPELEANVFVEKFTLDNINRTQLTVNGTVLDEDGLPLPGASVLEKGTLNGTQTDFDGNFTIKLSDTNAVLSISYIGYVTKEIAVNGQTSISVTLEEGAQALEEVVVTALGIKSEKRALGYATAQVGGDDIGGVKATNNFVNSLSGKVAGVQITSPSSQPGSGTRIVIRGGSSITGSNEPLIVVNGVPFNSGNTAQSSGLGDIDPNAIESVSVLKGAAAAALWGSRAANGVLIITTKSGGFETKPVITLSNSTSFDRIYEYPLQDKWAQGYWDGTDWIYIDGETAFTSTSWGPRIKDVPGAQKYDRWDIFQTGVTNETTLSASGGGSNGSYFVSYSNLMNDGVVEPLKYRRNVITANTSYKFTPKLTISTNMLYSTQKSFRFEESTSNGAFMNTVLAAPWTWNPYPIYAEDGRLRSYRGGSRNPSLWVKDNTGSNIERDRFNGSVTIDYKIIPNLKFRSVTGISTSSLNQNSFHNLGGYATAQGLYNTSEQFERNIESVETLTYDNDFGDISLNALIGHNISENRFRTLVYEGNGLVLPGIYNTANVSSFNSYESKSLFRSYSYFGQAMIGYKNWLYYTVTGRNDWASSVEDSFFYPSHSLGFVFSELLPRSNVFNYGKLRASYAKVGSPARAYARNVVLDNPNTPGVQWPFSGQSSYLSTTKIPNESLTNEFKNEVELGVELKFLNNRLGVDFAYYHNWSENQILSEQFLASTGFTYGDVNIGGITHKGVEISMNAAPIKTNNFQWDLTLNFAKDNSMVDKLGTNDEPISVGSLTSAVVGQPYPVLYGQGLLRDDQGRLVLDANPGEGQGRPLRDNRQNLILGQTAPDWIGGLRTVISYKNLSLSALLDVSVGGYMYSQNDGYLTYYGLAKRQEYRPEDNMITFSDGVMGYLENGEVVLTGDAPVPTRYDHYFQTNVAGSEEHIMPKDYIKLREANLTYRSPKEMLSKIGLSALDFTLSGRNLWRKFKDGFSDIDPEISTDGITNGNGYATYSLPATKTYTFTVTAKF
ncbi:TonB-linked outer membrane protein, SusC/RagA family [Arenibacter palladensis]|uniref:TonB-linked outer membrane protein, SusC/RagA family n=1 Tax=Arenibacter palladensis TaxID=237373 RepID=A0A1M5HJY2_9FLAO|nr:SusC/RagA family TonB-linked outer membrane protein [Arenibacter palladensis]SHG16237.1 TonB-linked outer membrane protein, SusC/RagA family [Arenibacter palladensis]